MTIEVRKKDLTFTGIEIDIKSKQDVEIIIEALQTFCAQDERQHGYTSINGGKAQNMISILKEYV